jgi:hypothetical protein
VLPPGWHLTQTGARGAARPLEHFLTDRKGRTLDVDQVRMYLQAITAVRVAIELALDLDAALAAVLADTLGSMAADA